MPYIVTGIVRTLTSFQTNVLKSKEKQHKVSLTQTCMRVLGTFYLFAFLLVWTYPLSTKLDLNLTSPKTTFLLAVCFCPQLVHGDIQSTFQNLRAVNWTTHFCVNTQNHPLKSEQWQPSFWTMLLQSLNLMQFNKSGPSLIAVGLV